MLCIAARCVSHRQANFLFADDMTSGTDLGSRLRQHRSDTPGTVFPESSPDECFQYEEYPIDAQGDADRISPVLSAIGRGVPKQQEFPRLLSHGEMCGVLEPHELLGWAFTFANHSDATWELTLTS